MFFDDAKEVSELLELTLTGRDCGLKERAPMCGVPYHAADAYIAKLVSFGKKVAICEQLTVPGAQPGLVKRGVIRIVSSGTMTEDKGFDSKCNNYILSACLNGSQYGIAWADITTGDFYCQQTNYEGMADVIARINPSEIIAQKDAYAVICDLPEQVLQQVRKKSEYVDNKYSFLDCTVVLKKQFGVATLGAFIPDDKPEAIRAAGALVSYINDSQMRKVDILSKITYFSDEKHLILDSTALKNLEVMRSLRDGNAYGSLLWAIDNTLTAGGGRKLKELVSFPLRDEKDINYRLDGVADLKNNSMVRESLRESMRFVKDLERLCGRLSNKILTPKDCVQIRSTLAVVPAIKFQLAGLSSKIINDIYANLGDYDKLYDILERVFVDDAPVTPREGKFVKNGFDEELDRYRNLHDNGSAKIREMEERERETTGIKTLRIKYNKVFGYYIEVTNSYLSQVPYNYMRKQTLVGAERFYTEELKKLEVDILSSVENSVRIENEIYEKVLTILFDSLNSMLKTAKCLSMLDCLLSFAHVAKKNNYVRPELLAAGKPLKIVEGRHPVVEAGGKITFIPNDTYLNNDDSRMMIITGPNMAGKSTYMRQVALITLMAHVGSFVPAKEAQIPLTDKIFTRVGASDNLMFNQSTFMVEMTEVASIVRNATENSMLILDEVGRGTSTFDGLSIAWAVVEYLTNTVKAKTLFATHYHELSELEGNVEGVKNYKIELKEINGEIVFLRKIVRGSANKSFGIEVASLSGIPKDITTRAKDILKTLENNDVTVKAKKSDENQPERQYSYVEKYLSTLDLNNVTPLQAFEILAYLKSKAQ